MKNLLQRTLTGIIFIALLIACILWNEYSFGILFASISALALWEFHRLLNENLSGVQVNKSVAAIGGIFLFACFFLINNCSFIPQLLYVYLLFVIGVFIAELYRQKENSVMNWAVFVLGQLYIALPFAFLNNLAFPKYSDYNATFLLAFFVIIWVNDTGAYVTGMTLGRHRLFERISPKKSWEGFFGGLIFSMGTAFLFYSFTKTQLSMAGWFVFSAIIVTFATFGDLSESLLKRTIGVKDSGNILPGHGGVLDRFDSVLFAAIAVAVFFL